MPSHPLTNFEIQKYYRNGFKFKDIYSGNNSPKIKNGAYVINIDNYKSIGTHFIALYVNSDNVTHFDSFGIDNVPKDIKKFTGNKNITINIYLFIMCRYFCIGFIDFVLKGKIFL